MLILPNLYITGEVAWPHLPHWPWLMTDPGIHRHWSSGFEHLNSNCSEPNYILSAFWQRHVLSVFSKDHHVWYDGAGAGVD